MVGEQGSPKKGEWKKEDNGETAGVISFLAGIQSFQAEWDGEKIRKSTQLFPLSTSCLVMNRETPQINL